ncbi:phage tail sheath subtilisin-like domain-containing protein [Paracoccaceae bacterium GXU_MW_L88]
MAETFLHGVDLVEIDSGVRPIQTVRSAVIGVVGNAPDADPLAFPLNVPVMIAGSRREAAGLGATGTLPDAIDGIFDQAGAVVVVVRVEEGETAQDAVSAVIGGVDAESGQYQGLRALLAAEVEVGVTPRIIIAPGFSHELSVATEMVSVAERLRAITVIDGPNTTDADALAYRENFGSARAYLVDPWVTVWDTEANADVIRPASDRVAGLIAKSDAERGFWHSPSNREILGITGIARPVDFTLGDANSRANLLNEKQVTTIIRKNGYRLWGNRSCSADPKWAFLKRRRIGDMIGDSIMRAHFWAVDRNITTTYFEDVIAGVDNYLRTLKQQQAIAGGRCWADPDLNTPTNMEGGDVFFDFDFVEYGTAEHVNFRMHINSEYLADVLPVAA